MQYWRFSTHYDACVIEGKEDDARIIMGFQNYTYIIERTHYPPSMRNKSILIAIVMVSSSLAGCTSDNSEEDLSARYQEGYDAGYGDAYDASYDGVAQHHYNEGWDDGWEIANSDSQAEIMVMQAEIMEMQTLASTLNATIISLQNANHNLENNNPTFRDLGNLRRKSVIEDNETDIRNNLLVSFFP